MANRLDVVAVMIKHKRTIVIGVVMLPKPGRTIVAPTGTDGG